MQNHEISNKRIFKTYIFGKREKIPNEIRLYGFDATSDSKQSLKQNKKALNKSIVYFYTRKYLSVFLIV